MPSDRKAAALIFALLCAVYVTGACPTFGPGRSAGLVADALTGVAGSLYGWLAFFAANLPGAPSFAVNALSGVAHAGAATLFFLVLRRQDLRAGPALAATALLASCQLYWYYAEVAETWALGDLLAVTCALAAVSFERNRRGSQFFWLAGALGLALSQQPTLLLLIPALAYWLHRPWPRRTAAAAAVFLAILFAAGWFGAGEQAHWTTGWGRWHLEGFVDRFEPMLLTAGAALGAPGLLLALLGAWSLWRGDQRPFGFWALWAGACLLVPVFGDRRPSWPCDPDYLRAALSPTCLPGLLGLFAFCGFGAQALLDSMPRALARTVLVLAAGLPPLLSPMSLRQHNPLMEYARALDRSAGPKDAVLLGAEDALYALDYLARVEHLGEERSVFLKGEQPPDWKVWLAAHPGSALFAEAALEGDLFKSFPGSYPSGILLRASMKPPASGLVAREAGEVALWDCLTSARRDDLARYGITQEVYLGKNYRRLLERYAEHLGAKDEDTALRLRALTAQL